MPDVRSPLPYNAISVLDGEVVKCDLCGGDPKCVKYCSTGAIQYLEETEEREAPGGRSRRG